MTGELRSSGRRHYGVTWYRREERSSDALEYIESSLTLCRAHFVKRMADLYMQRSRMEGDGTLARAVFAELKTRIKDRDRAGDLMGTMSAMGMIYFCSIEAATAQLVQRDLRIQSTEAELVVDACRQAVAQLEPQQRPRPDSEIVMALKTQARPKARATKRTGKGAKAPERQALEARSTLQVALYEKSSTQKSKPRKVGVIDEEVWNGSAVSGNNKGWVTGKLWYS